jgi:hypothetical protein
MAVGERYFSFPPSGAPFTACSPKVFSDFSTIRVTLPAHEKQRRLSYEQFCAFFQAWDELSPQEMLVFA